MLVELTKKYIKAFNDKNLEAVEALFHDDFALEDPVVNRIEGKENVLEAVKGIFDSCKELSFTGRNIYQDGNTTLIEFNLKLDSTELKGIDIIDWKDGKMSELRAYLDIPKE